MELDIWDYDEIPIPREELYARAPALDGIIALLSDFMDKDFFQRAPRLKVVSNYAVGYDNIQVAEAAKHNIVVTNTPDVLTEATADIAFGLILGASRRMGEAERLVRKGAWKSWGPTLLLGHDVYGATLGIVGTRTNRQGGSPKSPGVLHENPAYGTHPGRMTPRRDPAGFLWRSFWPLRIS